MSDGRKASRQKKWERTSPQTKSCGGRERMNYFVHPTLISIFLSDNFLPLFPTKGFRPTDTPFISRACWLGRHWARDREIESEREREWWWEYRFPSVGLHCSRASGVWDGTGNGEGARRERLCWGEGWGSDGGGEGMRERGYSVAAESPLACLLRSTSDWAAAH